MSNKILGTIGEKFGDYTVIDEKIKSTTDGKLMYHVKCTCGKIEFVRGYFLRNGRQTCCKSCRSKINYQKAIKLNKKVGFIKLKHSGIGELTQTVYSYFKRNEKRIRNNIDFKKMTTSLDRIDSNKGYLFNNVQWVHKKINLMKNNLNESYFIELCDNISSFNKNIKR